MAKQPIDVIEKQKRAFKKHTGLKWDEDPETFKKYCELHPIKKEPHNHRQEWTEIEIKQLHQLAKLNASSQEIASTLGRSEKSIKSMMGRLGYKGKS